MNSFIQAFRDSILITTVVAVAMSLFNFLKFLLE